MTLSPHYLDPGCPEYIEKIECRLADLSDNTPLNRERVLEMAQAYCKKSLDIGVTPSGLLEIFQAFTAGNDVDRQFWVVLDPTLVGFMVTTGVEYNGVRGLQVAQGYLERRYAGRRASHVCLEAVEEIARAHQLKFVSCITNLDPGTYGRWLRPAKYRRAYTAFLKEI